MRIWTNNYDHGLYPVGFAAIVVADTATDAAIALNAELTEQKLTADATAEEMEEYIPSKDKPVMILCNGDY